MTEPSAVVVTRPRSRAAPMMRALAEGGVEPILVAAIEIRPPDDVAALARAARRLEEADWVVFTSANGVRAVGDARSENRGGSDDLAPPPDGPRIAAVGPATARAVARRFGRPPDLVPAEHSAAGLLVEVRAHDPALATRSIVLPLGDLAGDTLPRGLRETGARVERVTAYRTTPPDRVEVERARAAIRAGRVGLVTFTSPSTVRNFLDAVGEEALSVPAAVIGPVTADAAKEAGFRVEAVAEPHTVEALVEATLGRMAALGPDGPEASESGRPRERG